MAKAAKPKPQEDQPGGEMTKTSFNIPVAIMDDVRHIVYTEKRKKTPVSQTDVLVEALKEYIERWEKKNGKIPR